MDWSIVVSSAGFAAEERRGKARGGAALSVEANTTSTAGKQQCNQSTANGGDTDSDLLHRNSPLRDTSVAAAMGVGVYPLRLGL
jgi:hypothetical protein